MCRTALSNKYVSNYSPVKHHIEGRRERILIILEGRLPGLTTPRSCRTLPLAEPRGVAVQPGRDSLRRGLT